MRKSRRVAGLPPGPTTTFLSLPAEVRRTIYQYIFRGGKVAFNEEHAALDSDDEEYTDSEEQKYETFVLVWPDGLHYILLTCRQCHTEATALFYVMTTFQYEDSIFEGHPLLQDANYFSSVQNLSIDSHIHWSKLDLDKFPALKTITAGTVSGVIDDRDEYAGDLAAAPDEHLLELAKKDIRFTEWSLSTGRMGPGDVEPDFELRGGVQLFYKIELRSEKGSSMTCLVDITETVLIRGCDDARLA